MIILAVRQRFDQAKTSLEARESKRGESIVSKWWWRWEWVTLAKEQLGQAIGPGLVF